MFKKRYENLPGSPVRKITWDTWKAFFHGMKRVKQTLPDLKIDWVNNENLKNRITEVGERNYISWLGHATYLLQLNKKTILIDPFFSERASPVQFMGPKRFVPPPLSIEELPKVDFILITHNHFDHLDLPFLKQWPYKDYTKIIVPSSLGKTIKRAGFSHIEELAWYQTFTEAGVSFTALPAYHYSRRGLFDKNTSHWCSYMLSTDAHRIFHSGDTGYGEIFKALGEKYGPFDFAMLGIGSYQPVEMMKAVHTNPQEAVQIAKDLGAKCVLPMHWGTVPLSTEPLDAPLKEFQQALLNGMEVQLKRIGDLILI